MSLINLKEILSILQGPFEKLWYAVTNEKIKQLKVEAITKVFITSLNNKNFQIKAGKAEISRKELEQEPKKMTSDLEVELRKIK